MNTVLNIKVLELIEQLQHQLSEFKGAMELCDPTSWVPDGWYGEKDGYINDVIARHICDIKFDDDEDAKLTSTLPGLVAIADMDVLIGSIVAVNQTKHELKKAMDEIKRNNPAQHRTFIKKTIHSKGISLKKCYRQIPLIMDEIKTFSVCWSRNEFVSTKLNRSQVEEEMCSKFGDSGLYLDKLNQLPDGTEFTIRRPLAPRLSGTLYFADADTKKKRFNVHSPLFMSRNRTIPKHTTKTLGFTPETKTEGRKQRKDRQNWQPLDETLKIYYKTENNSQ